jgi:hypothetical protein
MPQGRRKSGRSALTITVALAALGSLGATGCWATFTPIPAEIAYEGGVLVPADTVPPNIWAYPRTYFDGTYAYLAGGVWYFPTPQGWMVYRREPVELSRERTRIYSAPEVGPYRRTPSYGFPPAPPPPVRRYVPR